jgi:excinuclease UvrABC ATPase subunit
MEPDRIVITGARQHNLKNVTVEIPKKKLVIFTGVSGSGKSSLAFDTLYAEGQRRYIESLSAYARQFLGQMDKPLYDAIRGLAPTISIEQKAASANPRSTVGTITEIHDYLRVLFARAGTPAEVTALLSQEVDKALAAPDVKERIGAVDIVGVGGSPAQAASVLKAAATKWAPVVQRIGLRLD